MIHHAKMLLDCLALESARRQHKSLHATIEKRFKLRLELGRRGAGYNDLFVSRPAKKYIVCARSTLFVLFCNFTL